MQGGPGNRQTLHHATGEGADRISWVDVSRCPEKEVAPGLSKEQALARFHVHNVFVVLSVCAIGIWQQYNNAANA